VRNTAAAIRIAILILSVCRISGAQTLPSPWASTDVGGPTLSGSATHASGVFTINAAGADIWGTADQFHFVYQQVSGDVEIVARVQGVTAQHAWSKAGVMIRATLAADSPHAYALASAGKGVNFQWRAAKGGLSASTAASTPPPPSWVRAVRAGTKVTTYWSANGTTWTTMGSVTLPIGSSAYVGLAVTSHDAGARTTATVSNVSVVRTGLAAGQQNADIGAPALAGAASYASGAYTVRAAGEDIWGTADQFHFVYQPMSGNVELVARVASLTSAHSWTKAGVMVRESLSAGSRHATMFASTGKGYAFQRRPETGGLSVHTAGGTGAPPGWLRLVRTGDLFQAYRSSDGVSWTATGSDTIPMGTTVYVGLAVTSHNATTAATAVMDNVRIAGTTTTNGAPAVTLTAPATGVSYTLPATVAMTANATDPEGRMAAVDFYAGSTLVSRDTTAPYAASWSPVAAGTYSLTAIAYDADGGSSASAAVTVVVGTAPVPAPRAVVFGASPDHHTSAVTSYVLDVFVAGADPSTATPLASSNLGKPAPAANNDITVDRLAFFIALAPGAYTATISAVGPGGRARSPGVAFTR